jgi:hypothetical protein
MTNSQIPPCAIGDRIECGNSFGTVRYVGPIDGKPSIWLGIEWDEPERGKHDGNVNGIQYFTAKNPKSGSFVRPEKVNFGRSAIASIESRYGQVEDEFTTRINQQKQLLVQQTMNAPFLEMVGFDKVFNKQSNLNTLRIVNLRDQNVKSAGPQFKLSQTCPNIEELDISKNLLVSWEDVLVMCDQLPHLHWLNVSENLLRLPESLGGRKFPNVKTLICGAMELNWTDVCEIARIFHGLEEFRAPHNKIESLSPPRGIFNNLQLLDIEGNKIQYWSEVCKLSAAPVLEQLILENTGLSSIEFEGNERKVPVFRTLKKLCIVNNLLSEWRSIGELNRLENLDHLKISKNPVTETERPDTTYQIIIAKIANLKILNGVEIEPGERRGAEYDYIKKYGLEWLKVKGTEWESEFLRSHNRYLELIHKYGEPEESELTMKATVIQNSLIELNIVYEDFVVHKKMPPTITIQKLMVLTQKIFSLSERPQLTYVSNADSQIEIPLKDEMKEIGAYSIQNGDKILVKSCS